jgi:WD40 repeat protein
MDQDIYIITTGLEGMIHMWRFNTVSSLAEYVCAFEGHVREVTSILLKGEILSPLSLPPLILPPLPSLPTGNLIWSGSVDCTINIWDVTTRAVVHTIKSEESDNFDNATSSGHATAITCMTKITAPNGEFVATASLDGVLMIWDAEAKKTYECTEQATITTMNVAMDSFGKPTLLPRKS